MANLPGASELDVVTPHFDESRGSVDGESPPASACHTFTNYTGLYDIPEGVTDETKEGRAHLGA
jgi:hypothetical protein